MSNNSFGVVDKEYTGRRVTQQGPIAANQPIELPIYISDKQQVMVHINNGTGSRLLTVNEYEYSAGGTSNLYLPTINVSASETVHVMFLGAVPYDQTIICAPLASPALTGTPTAPTAAAGTNTTQVATTAFVQTANGVGQVVYFAMTSAPVGWLKANGAAVSRETYAALFAAIGTSFGVGDGSTTFNLPDLRGSFLRGWDDGRGVDGGRVFGSIQESANKYHDHGGISQPAGAHGHTAWTDSQGGHNHSFTYTLRDDGSSGGWGASYRGSPITLPNANGAMYTGVRWDVVSNAGGHVHNVGIGTGGNHEHYIDNDGEVESRPVNMALLACIRY